MRERLSVQIMLTIRTFVEQIPENIAVTSVSSYESSDVGVSTLSASSSSSCKMKGHEFRRDPKETSQAQWLP